VKIDTRPRPYYILVKCLHQKAFSWIIPNDDNRAMDGIKLREEYLNRNGGTAVGFVKRDPCSIFEMLIALARRMDFELGDPNDPKDRTYKYFWILIENLGLNEYTDDNYAEAKYEFNLDNIIDTFLDRTYFGNGVGGLFPLKYPHEDQRDIEIWYQMNAYLDENYKY
jgi:hypothetical protein